MSIETSSQVLSIDLENILLEFKDDLESLRISDFGLAVKAGGGQQYSLSLKCGTPVYMAPEMFLDGGKYTKSVDMWSIGVILFRLLKIGQFPFTPAELKEIAVSKGNDMKMERLFRDINCSFNCMHLLRRLLEPDPLKRYQSYVAAIHPFITGEDKLPTWTFREQETMQETQVQLSKVDTFLEGLEESSCCGKAKR